MGNCVDRTRRAGQVWREINEGFGFDQLHVEQEIPAGS